MTIHPETGAILPVCGTHRDPVTTLPIAIEVMTTCVAMQIAEPVILQLTVLLRRTSGCFCYTAVDWKFSTLANGSQAVHC